MFGGTVLQVLKRLLSDEVISRARITSEVSSSIRISDRRHSCDT